jgi:hypothetical protein
MFRVVAYILLDDGSYLRRFHSLDTSCNLNEELVVIRRSKQRGHVHSMLAGHQQEIQAERDRKLDAAREQRLSGNRNPFHPSRGPLTAILPGKGRPEGSIRRAVSLGHLHAYQTISEVQATSIVPKNK